MNRRLLGLSILIVILAGGGLYWRNTRSVETTAAPTNQDAPITLEPISYQGVEGETALTLLKQAHSVETKTYSFGEMVVSIDGRAATGTTNFWEFLVNGQQATVGAGEYITKAADQIEWRLSDVVQ